MDQKTVINKPERVISLKPVVIGFSLQFFFFIFHIIVGGWTQSNSLEKNSHFLLLSSGFWGLAFLHSFFKKKAVEEKNEIQRVENLRLERGVKSALFQNNEIVAGSFQQNLVRFEKYFLPIACFIFSGILMGFGYLIYQEFKFLPFQDSPKNIFKACAFIASISFLLLVAGLYIRGLAKGDYGYLRGPATIMLTGAGMCLAESATLLAFTNGWLENLNPLFIIGSALSFFVGLELLLNTFLFLIKPVHREESKLPPYDSRVFLLLTSTGSAWKSLNGMIDYQFGFRVSESWLYKTFLKLILPFVVFQIIAGLLCTSFVIINSGQIGYVERLGRPLNQGIGWEPGLHFKMPWPIDEVKKINITQVATVEVGHKNDDHEKIDPKQLGTLEHYQETDLYVVKRKAIDTTDEKINGANEDYLELISVSAVFQYQPNPKQLSSYLYQYQSLEEPIQTLIRSELLTFLSEKIIAGSLGSQASTWNQEFKKRFYKKVEVAIPGIIPMYLSLKNIHVPAELSESVNEIFVASEKKKVEVFNSEIDAIKIGMQSEQEVLALTSSHKNEILRLEANDETKRILNLKEVFSKFKKIFKQREWLEVIEKVFADANIDFVSSKVKVILEDGNKGGDPLEDFSE
jgi:regulator of protease activity HflC (stomatin/prohibitin superfamily)